MATVSVKPLAAWKKVKISAKFENSVDFDCFGGLEVLEDYEVIKTDDVVPLSKKKLSNCSVKETNSTVPKTNKQPASLPENDILLECPQAKKRKISTHDSKDQNSKSPPVQKKKSSSVDNDTLEKPLANSEDLSDQKPVKKLAKRIKTQSKNHPKSVSSKSVPVKEAHNQIKGCSDQLSVDMSGWKDLFVPSEVLQSLKEKNFCSPTLIQALVLPSAIRDKQDILGAAETGSGKTLAFGIPVIDRILKLKEQQKTSPDEQEAVGLYALVLTPTRELCVQVRDHLKEAAKYTGLKVVSIFGGMSVQKQKRLLSKTPEIIVATPGRLWDVMQQEEHDSYMSSIVTVPLLVVDEADKMIEKGHFEELTKILNLMKEDEISSRRRQSFVFSATLMYIHQSPDRLNKKIKKRKNKVVNTTESKIAELIEAVGILKKPKVIDVTEKNQTAGSLVESCVFCTQADKDLYLYYLLTSYPGRTLVFTNSIDCIRRLLSVFKLLKMPLLPLHADMHQKQRLKNLERFRESKDAVLVATDVAARGLDIPDIEHVIHYQIPRTSESYVHRSGRTARAKKDGLSVLVVDEKEIQNYRKIIKSLNKEDSVLKFPILQSELKPLKQVVSLAQKIDQIQHQADKENRKNNWFSKMAKEADMDDTESDSDSVQDMEQKSKDEIKQRKALEGMKAELDALISQKTKASSLSYSGKYPTSSGKFEIPKSLAQKKDIKAITIVSRKHKG